MEFDQIVTLQVGNKVTWKRVIGTSIAVILVSALFTGFGYQPFWLFLVVLILGFTVTLPACFNSYWIIYEDNLKMVNFSKNNLTKMVQLFGLVSMNIEEVNYSEIKTANIEYRKRQRISPFDIGPDCLEINFKLKNGKAVLLPIEPELIKYLAKFKQLLEQSGVKVIDSQHVLSILKSGDSLFEHFNA